MTYDEHRLGAAFAGSENLQLLYQPIVNLKTFIIEAVEALIRLNDPQCGTLLPDAFMPALLNSEVRARVTYWTFATAANQLALWESMGFKSLRMCVNVAAQDLLDCSLVTYVSDAARCAGVAPERMEIEVSEHDAITDVPQALDTIRRLRSDGFRIAVDDFGAGSASLRYLLDIPASTIKVDRSFIAGSSCDRHATVLEGACELATALGYEVVVEGIENLDQYRLASNVAAGFGQGHYFGRPQIAESLLRHHIHSSNKLADSGGLR